MLDHFSLAAPFYDRVLRFLDPTVLQEHLRLPVAGRLLDAAGGTGRVSQYLAGLAGQIVVTDASAAMLQQATAKGGLTVVLARAERLPFADATFERIVVVDALHHFADQRAAIREMWRVLAPGGRMVIEEPNIETRHVKLVALAERLALMRSRFLSPQDMASMLRQVGGHVEIFADHAFNVWVTADKGG